jgi:predicted RNase H-like HicB family nuclease
MKYRILLEQYEDGDYEATCTNLPGFISQGATRSEVLGNIQAAIEDYIKNQHNHSEANPQPAY